MINHHPWPFKQCKLVILLTAKPHLIIVIVMQINDLNLAILSSTSLEFLLQDSKINLLP